MKKLLNQKEQHYADTREEAEAIVETAKENNDLMMHKITEKHNKYGQYFLVDLTYQYGTPKEVMEGRPDDEAPEGQLSIDEVHEGIDYTVDNSGVVSVKQDEKSDDEDSSEVPF
ncbi:hypothetical protein ACFQ38_12030 [Sporosarcina contaminans]|uniref:Organic solvent tolerance protein OstA n=1 Tax=Sporosarcina contaminans TaxID=633403 RepID=A0ABW3U2A9_9BACL